jgi:hypothetical protein
LGSRASSYSNGKVTVTLSHFSRGTINGKPLEKSIELSDDIWHELTDNLEQLEDAFNGIVKGEECNINYEIGDDVRVSLSSDHPFVNIRQYWMPPKCKDLVPTRKGVCFGLRELRNLKEMVAMVELYLPERVPFCYHQNQLGALQCPRCNRG